jgi:hypothetical protein
MHTYRSNQGKIQDDGIEILNNKFDVVTNDALAGGMYVFMYVCMYVMYIFDVVTNDEVCMSSCMCVCMYICMYKFDVVTNGALAGGMYVCMYVIISC